MDAVRKIIEHSSNPLQIDLPVGYENKKLEVIVLAIEEKSDTTIKYDFSDVAGMLEWKGNALEEQKKLRNEWE
ncbi:MAG: hypothetical protein K2Q24_09125 [Chitinophagaceae bacterium]|jgi:hypothetical protein|nr:hypothetical protein [Chitinophagaceae bacterium]